MNALLLALWIAAQAAATPAKPVAVARTQSAPASVPASVPNTVNATQTDPAPATNPDAPLPAPPSVTYNDGKLTVVAGNAALNEVLKAIGTQAGVTIDGAMSGHERIAAKVGPAPVRDVLISLLEGSHYDFVILSDNADSRRVARLVLTQRATGPAPASAQKPTADEPEDVPIGTVITLSSPDYDDDDAAKPVAAPQTTPVQTAPAGKKTIPAEPMQSPNGGTTVVPEKQLQPAPPK